MEVTANAAPHLKRWMKKAVHILCLVFISTWLGCGSRIELQPTVDEDSPTGVLIPANLAEALEEFDAMLPLKTKKRFLGDSDFASEVHLSLGMWIRNYWGLWSDSVLARWFNSQGITHPDYMSSALLDSYASYLSGNREFGAILEEAKARDRRHRISGKASEMIREQFKQKYGMSDPASSYNYSGIEVSEEEGDEIVTWRCVVHTHTGKEIPMVARYSLASDDPDIQISFEETSNQAREVTADAAPPL